MKVPKSFKVFATTIRVVFENERLNDKNLLGESSYVESKISLIDTNSMDKLSKDKILDVFYHEKVHIILDSMNKQELSRDEDFVDIFAKLWRQSDETAKY